MKTKKRSLKIMNKLVLYILSLLLLNTAVFSQVVVSPYAALTDNTEKKAFITVSNNSLEPQDITITFRFAHEVSDEKGFTDVKYLKTNEKSDYDLSPMLTIGQNRFTLRPGERRDVEINIEAPAGLPEGTYWTKIFTSYKTRKTSNEGAGSGTLPVFTQVTTLIYKNDTYRASLSLDDIGITFEKGILKILTGYTANGNPPFFAEADIKIIDSEGRVVKEKVEYFAVYFSLKRGSMINVSELPAGDYTLELTAGNNKNGMPLPDYLIEPQVRTLGFTIP
jgi:hypothetical protein